MAVAAEESGINGVRTIPLKQETKPCTREYVTLRMKRPLSGMVVLDDTYSRWMQISLAKS